MQDALENQCDTCGHAPKRGNIVFCSDGSRPLCPDCNEARLYSDADGNPCSLDALCRLDPDWAANRIRAMDSAQVRHDGGIGEVVTQGSFNALCDRIKTLESRQDEIRGQWQRHAEADHEQAMEEVRRMVDDELIVPILRALNNVEIRCGTREVSFARDIIHAFVREAASRGFWNWPEAIRVNDPAPGKEGE